MDLKPSTPHQGILRVSGELLVEQVLQEVQPATTARPTIAEGRGGVKIRTTMGVYAGTVEDNYEDPLPTLP